jgi:hypothetical protein
MTLATCFHPARYAKRYAPLQRALVASPGVALDPRHGPPPVVTLAVGVSGWIPNYTRSNIARVFGVKTQQSVVDDLILIAQIWAIRGWKAFKRETPIPNPSS